MNTVVHHVQFLSLYFERLPFNAISLYSRIYEIKLENHLALALDF